MELQYVKLASYEKKRTKDCIYNDGCKCQMKTCWKCGWNPKVHKKRMEKLMKAVNGCG